MKEKTQKWAVCLAFLFCCAVMALPYASGDLAAGHDALFHILRIEGLAEALRGGASWPVPVYSLLLGGYGYAAGLFYPDIFLLPAALLRAGGLVGPEVAFKLTALAFGALAAGAAYLAGREVTAAYAKKQARLGGAVCMVLYALGHAHLANLFIRSALGEVQAMAFLPLVLWGLWDLTEQGFQRPWLLTLAFAGLALTHTISLLLSLLVAAVWTLARAKRVWRPRTLLRLGLAAGTALALSCWWWQPMLEQFGADTFKVTAEPLTHLQLNTVPLAQYLDPADYMGPGLMGFVLAAAVLLAAAWRAARQGLGAVRFPLALGAAAVLLSLGTIRGGPLPWAELDKSFLGALQFPWRVNGYASLFLALAAAVLCVQLASLGPKWAERLPLLALAAACGLGLAEFALFRPQLPEEINLPANAFAQRGETFYLVGQEWVPAGVDIRDFAAEPAAQWTDAVGAHEGAYQPDGSFVFEDGGAPGKRGIPKLWYLGYEAVYTESDGQETALPLAKDGAGRVELTVPQGLAPGVVAVRYAGTPTQRFSAFLSLFTFLLVLWAGVHAAQRSRAQARGEAPPSSLLRQALRELIEAEEKAAALRKGQGGEG